MESTLSIILTALPILLTAYLGFYFAVKQLKHDLRKEVQGAKYTKILEAHQQFWKLLAYTTDTENKQSILRWAQNPDKSKIYIIRKGQAQEFIDQLAAVFYSEGHGLFLPKSMRPLFFEYRSILYGVLLKTKDNTAEEIIADNPKMVERMLQLHQEMVESLRHSIGLTAPDLPKNP